MTHRIGFIGIGTMGRPMATNLLKAGYAIRAYNRTPEKCDPLVEIGAEVADSYRDAAHESDVVITMLSDSPDVREVVLGQEGVIEACKPGTTIIDMSTISPSVASEIAAECEKAGVAFLDAPVTGGEKGAIAGTLSIMVGGDAEALERVRPVLLAMGSKITHMGGSGLGQTAKLCNQVICGINMVAACEGLALGAASGLDPGKLLEAISSGAAGSWVLSNLCPKMINGDWAPGFRVVLQQKDLRLALEAAANVLLPLMGTGLASQLFRGAEAAGFGDEGTQSLFKFISGLGE